MPNAPQTLWAQGSPLMQDGDYGIEEREGKSTEALWAQGSPLVDRM